MSGDPPDPRAAGLFNPELGFPPWGDPTMGGHPEIVEHFSQSNDYGGRGSRSPSRSSSGSSRGSSVDRRLVQYQESIDVNILYRIARIFASKVVRFLLFFIIREFNFYEL